MLRKQRPRSSYFVTSKIPGGLDYAGAMAQLEQSIAQLEIPYVDMMLVHFPATWGGKGGKKLRQEGWKAIEDFYKAVRCRYLSLFRQISGSSLVCLRLTVGHVCCFYRRERPARSVSPTTARRTSLTLWRSRR